MLSMRNKQVTFVIKLMSGGGAERVISLLSSALVARGYTVNLILTHQQLKNAQIHALHPSVSVSSLIDIESKNFFSKKIAKILFTYARLIIKICKTINNRESQYGLIVKYWARNYVKISHLTKILSVSQNNIVISFLNDSIFYSLLATRHIHKLIISERSDPEKYLENKTTMAFIQKRYSLSQHMVFQSPDAAQWYSKRASVNGKVIFNPVTPDLPLLYTGDRQKRIVNFCRISPEKNLVLLVSAFAQLHQQYSDYDLYIYGNADNGMSHEYYLSVEKHIAQSSCCDHIHLLPARDDIHEEIKDYAMFVSSSDFEGMSNSMLEAMAMGIPVVCTDCPAGGARAVIEDHVNGLLVPVGDVEALYKAMKELIDKPELAAKISSNATAIRDTLSVDKITNQWLELIHG